METGGVDLLQSEGWEQFQRALGRKTERVDGVLAIRMTLPFGWKYLYAPRASFPRHLERSVAQPRDLTSRVADDNRAVFWRAEFGSELSPPKADPPLAETLNYPLSTPLVLRRALEPEWTWRTSLDGTDDALLARMHEKHRYNVRLAERRGVGVRRQPAPTMASGASATFGDDAWRLLQETARRQGISTHPRRYYETMLRELSQTTLYIAEREDEALAAAIVAYHGDTATYLHGGSSHAHRQHMAPHLLHWSAMRAARDAGMRWYDWGGVQPQIPDSRFQIPNSTWSGITRFKQGFGGEAVRHPPTRDLVFRPGWYRMLSWLARIRVR